MFTSQQSHEQIVPAPNTEWVCAYTATIKSGNICIQTTPTRSAPLPEIFPAVAQVVE